MKYRIVIAIALITYTMANGQSNELIGQYYLNLPAYSPALAGSDDYLNITTGFRQQWTGFSGSPFSGFVSAYSSIKPYGADSARTVAKHGVGGYLMTNSQGSYKQNEASLVYSYHIPVAKNTYLSLGMSPVFYSEKIEVPQVVVEDQSDPAYQSLINQGNKYSSVHLNAGIGLHSNKFYLSYSLRGAVGASLSGNKEIFNSKTDKRHHFLAGYTLPVTKQLDIIPNTFVRIDQVRPALIELGVRARYNQNMWAGISYRNDKTMVGSLGFLYKEKFQFGYAFEYKSFGISQYARGTHEIIVGLRLMKNKKSTNYRTPTVVKPVPEPVVIRQEPVKVETPKVAPKPKVLSTSVRANDGQALTNVTLEVKNLTTQEVQNTVLNGASFKTDMVPGNDYQITATKEGFLPETIQVLSSEVEGVETEKLVNITLKKVGLFKKLAVGEMIEMDLHYDVNKTEVKAESLPELDKLIQLLKDDPSLKIEVGSHTDARGSNEANHTLSQKRSESAIKYLVSKGIEKSRLIATGYGETKLKVVNAKTESEHAQNRRTTIRIVGN